jgi:hypothetical protein
MNRVQDKFWQWATGSFIRLGTVLVVAHAVLTTPFKKKETR